MSVKYIHVPGVSDKIYAGQVITAGSYYQIQEGEKAKFAGDNNLINDLTLGTPEAIMSTSNDSNGHFADGAHAVSFLLGDLAQTVKVQPSNVPVTLRIEGLHFNAPINQTTNNYWQLPDTYKIRGAEFQAVGAEPGDTCKMWIRDHNQILLAAYGQAWVDANYPNYPRLTEYVPQMFLFKDGGNAPVIDLVDDDVSEPVDSNMFVECELTITRTTGSAVDFICNFWMYKDGST